MKSNYETGRDRKYPHCLVVGLSKGPRKVSKRFLKGYEEKLKALEGKEGKADQIQRLKSLGVFIKTYNMSHLLVTRYNVKEDFGIESAMKKVESCEKELKAAQEKVNKTKSESKKKENKEEIKKVEEELGVKKDEYKNELKNMKQEVGKQMLERFMQGFVSGKTQEEKEKEEHTQFLFKKLKF